MLACMGYSLTSPLDIACDAMLPAESAPVDASSLLFEHNILRPRQKVMPA